mgnify:CR=1 FL=1
MKTELTDFQILCESVQKALKKYDKNIDTSLAYHMLNEMNKKIANKALQELKINLFGIESYMDEGSRIAVKGIEPSLKKAIFKGNTE